MKGLTGFICMIFCLSLIMPNSFIAYAENEITLTKREESFVETLGFIDEISDKYASRKTYAKAVLKAGGKLQNEDEVSDERLGEMAKANKVLGVFDDGGTGLSENVTYAEVLLGLIRILGYDVILNGDYSVEAVMSCASELGLTDVFSKSGNDCLTEKELAKLLYRSLDIEIMELRYNSGDISVEQSDEKTLLQAYHNIYSVKGTVTANEYTTLSKAEGIAENTICIDDIFTLNTGKTDAKFYLGYAVECWYRLEDGDAEVIWIDIDKQCKDIYLETHEIVSYKDMAYTYESGSRDKTARLASNVSIIYNSKAVSLSMLSDRQLIPSVGDVTLIDTDSDNEIEVVIIMDYDSYITSGASEEYILDLDGRPILDISDIDYEIYNKGYSPVKTDSILANSVLWIAQSYDKKLAVILVSTENITGIVSEVEDDGRYKIITVDGVKYRISPKCEGVDLIKLGLGAVFYLDTAGNVAGFKAQANADMKYGYVLRSAIDEDDDSTLMLRIYNGNFNIIKCAERVKIDDVTARTPEKINDALSDDGGVFVPQLIRYQLNSDGKISKIETAKIPDDGEKITNRLFLEAEIPATATGSQGVYYLPGYDHFMTYYFAFDSTSQIFCIPEDLGNNAGFKLISPDLLSEGVINGMKAYKTDWNSDYCVVGVYCDSTEGIDKTNVTSKSSYVVSDIKSTINDDDEPVLVIECYLGMNKQSYTVDDEDLVNMIENNVHVGDIVSFDFNVMDNTLTTFRKDYDYETRTVVGTMKDNNSYTAQYMLYGGKVAQKMSNSVKLTRDSQALIRPYIQYDFLLFTKTTFLEYTVSRGKLVLNRGLMNNIYIGDDMAYTSINGQPRTVFLIK